ncbi:MAG: hypothetical protein ACLSHO_10955 [Dysosmobacter sp.]
MKEQLEAIACGALDSIVGLKARGGTVTRRGSVAHQGKKGELTAVLKPDGQASPPRGRPVMGQMANEVHAPPWKRPLRPSPPFWKVAAREAKLKQRDAGRHHPRQGGGSGATLHPHVHCAGRDRSRCSSIWALRCVDGPEIEL